MKTLVLRSLAFASFVLSFPAGAEIGKEVLEDPIHERKGVQVFELARPEAPAESCPPQSLTSKIFDEYMAGRKNVPAWRMERPMLAPDEVWNTLNEAKAFAKKPEIAAELKKLDEELKEILEKKNYSRLQDLLASIGRKTSVAAFNERLVIEKLEGMLREAKALEGKNTSVKLNPAPTRPSMSDQLFTSYFNMGKKTSNRDMSRDSKVELFSKAKAWEDDVDVRALLQRSFRNQPSSNPYGEYEFSLIQLRALIEKKEKEEGPRNPVPLKLIPQEKVEPKPKMGASVGPSPAQNPLDGSKFR